ncbi:MAG TPA: DUF3341 domain-containing protein [Bacteroidales bacterium]|nr:DUF3341 domain-containing protein [Bacteroidales bacterium]HPE57317.1 DUF3341 domain-containing protein [Bacteroidales bacterium]HRX95837.1 DUF3341 domain-containing protein [Bacteroidales bacterium]
MNNTAIYGVFDNEDSLLSAVRKISDRGIQITDVVSPYPIEELFHILKLKTRIPVLAFMYGVFGMLATFGFLYWTSVVNYPLVFGGKPQNTLSFVIVIFVMIINITIASTLTTFFLREKKGPGAVPKYDYPGMTDDKYFIIIEKSAELDADAVNALLKSGGAIEITEK